MLECHVGIAKFVSIAVLVELTTTGLAHMHRRWHQSADSVWCHVDLGSIRLELGLVGLRTMYESCRQYISMRALYA